MEYETSLALTLRYTPSRIVTGAQYACDITLLTVETKAMVLLLPTRRPYCSLGAGPMTTWAIKDSSGQTLPGFLGSSRIEVGCKVMPARYDAFRLHVSASYRELFDRALQQVLQRNGWEIVQLSQATTRPAGSVHAPPHRPGLCESTAPPLTHVNAQASREGP
jgi:hypothetical protein